eukprot:7384301-Prymnesium_polylepis.1
MRFRAPSGWRRGRSSASASSSSPVVDAGRAGGGETLMETLQLPQLSCSWSREARRDAAEAETAAARSREVRGRTAANRRILYESGEI